MARQSSNTVLNLTSSNTELPLDPFLSGLTEHQRQESADSGLGMAVTQSYSMPHTPEDFLASMDDHMDCSSENGTNMDASDMTLADGTDDLVPSLQVNIVFLISICIMPGLGTALSGRASSSVLLSLSRLFP